MRRKTSLYAQKNFVCTKTLFEKLDTVEREKKSVFEAPLKPKDFGGNFFGQSL